MGNSESEQRTYTNGRSHELEGVSDIRVMKFGGTSVGNARAINLVTDIVENDQKEGEPLVMVVSAMAGVTNRLVRICDALASKDIEEVNMELRAVLDTHYTAISELALSPGRRDFAKQGVRTLAQSLFKDTHSNNPSTTELRDRIVSYGERMSARVVSAALTERKIPVVVIDSSDFLDTNGDFGNAVPDDLSIRERSRRIIIPLVSSGKVVLTTGFIGRSPDGKVTTLGRGGSDLSASLLGKALDASEVWIWTDVDGVYTADPNRVADAEIIYEMSMAQADQMAKAGAKVLHARTLEPLMGTNTSLRVKNTFNATHPGTLVRP